MTVFKNYYLKQIWVHHKGNFSDSQLLPVYKAYRPIFTTIGIALNSIFDKCNGLSFVDSSSTAVCKCYRISMRKVFAGIAARGKTTKRWFYGLKLHLIINRSVGIVKASFFLGNRDDRKQLNNPQL